MGRTRIRNTREVQVAVPDYNLTTGNSFLQCFGGISVSRRGHPERHVDSLPERSGAARTAERVSAAAPDGSPGGARSRDALPRSRFGSPEARFAADPLVCHHVFVAASGSPARSGMAQDSPGLQGATLDTDPACAKTPDRSKGRCGPTFRGTSEASFHTGQTAPHRRSDRTC